MIAFIEFLLHHRITQFLYRYLLAYLTTQILITITIIPLYTTLGIPISFLSFIGNLVFLPFLFLFIIVSLIIFISALFLQHISLCTFLLKKIFFLWLSFMRWGSNSSLSICLAHPGVIIYILCWSTTIILVCYCISQKKQLKTFVYCSLSLIALISLLTILTVAKPKMKIITSQYCKWPLAITYSINNTLICFEYSNNSRIISNKKYYAWQSYTLMPECIKTWATQTICCYKRNNNTLRKGT